jgi:hypothetical protein
LKLSFIALAPYTPLSRFFSRQLLKYIIVHQEAFGLQPAIVRLESEILVNPQSVAAVLDSDLMLFKAFKVELVEQLKDHQQHVVAYSSRQDFG